MYASNARSLASLNRPLRAAVSDCSSSEIDETPGGVGASAVARRRCGGQRPFLRRQRAQIRDDALNLRGRQARRGRHRRARRSALHRERDLRVAALHLPRERSDLGRKLAERTRKRRRRSTRSRRDTSRSSACTALRPRRSRPASFAASSRTSTTFQRCAAVSDDANAGIAVPVTPTEILRKIIAGATDAMAAAVPITGGFGVSDTPAGPSPNPRGTVTGRAVRLVDPLPVGNVELGRKLERGFAAERGGEPLVQRGESSGRLLGGDGGDDRVEDNARARRLDRPTAAPRRARASFRKSTASWYSSMAIRRPLSSTPFPYSSTATLTMFATR